MATIMLKPISESCFLGQVTPKGADWYSKVMRDSEDIGLITSVTSSSKPFAAFIIVELDLFQDFSIAHRVLLNSSDMSNDFKFDIQSSLHQEANVIPNPRNYIYHLWKIIVGQELRLKHVEEGLNLHVRAIINNQMSQIWPQSRCKDFRGKDKHSTQRAEGLRPTCNRKRGVIVRSKEVHSQLQEAWWALYGAILHLGGSDLDPYLDPEVQAKES
ncbi:hypothetical protein C8J56DRAFT_900370 [Mycena floridula]|nr:hypothetical protein C8J56DRAFT_900370 [Mycena floridula]